MGQISEHVKTKFAVRTDDGSVHSEGPKAIPNFVLRTSVQSVR